MIWIPVLSYSENETLDYEITEFVNEVLEDILTCTIELHEDAKSINGSGNSKSYIIEGISPGTMFRENSKKCENTLYELRELIDLCTIRFRMHPRYYFFLYRCIERFVDVFEDADEGEEKLNRTVCEPLRSKVMYTYGENMVHIMENVSEYLFFCFDDTDFLPEDLSAIVDLYLSGSPFFNNLMSPEELDNFVELMGIDQREKYLQMRSKEKTENEATVQQFQPAVFSHNLKKALLQIQRNRLYWDVAEDDLNMALRDRLAMLYETHDQTMQGQSETGVKNGELDFLVYHRELPVAIAEALKLGSVDKSNISKHINKTLENYDPNGLPYAYIIVYSTASSFTNFYQSLIDYLEQYKYPYPVAEKIQVMPTGYAELRQAITILERNNTPIYLNYFVVNLNYRERVEH